jgi:carbon storage regulator
MLVLSRKKDECIVINNDITIVVVEIRGDKVRLGVEAPKEVPVHRREVFEAIARGEHAVVESPRTIPPATDANSVSAACAAESSTVAPSGSVGGIVVSGTKALPSTPVPRDSETEPSLANTPRGAAHSPPSADAVS